MAGRTHDRDPVVELAGGDPGGELDGRAGCVERGLAAPGGKVGVGVEPALALLQLAIERVEVLGGVNPLELGPARRPRRDPYRARAQPGLVERALDRRPPRGILRMVEGRDVAQKALVGAEPRRHPLGRPPSRGDYSIEPSNLWSRDSVAR